MQASRILRSLTAKQGVRFASGGHEHGKYGANEIVTTLNDLPSPQGSWKTHYDANQRKYNAHLVIGISAVIGSIIFGKAVGYLEFYNDIPERPADIPFYK